MNAAELTATATRLLRHADALHAYARAALGEELSDQEAAARATAASLLRKAERLG